MHATGRQTEGFAAAVWDREARVWRVSIGGELIRGAQGQVLAWGGFNEAYDAADQLNRRNRTGAGEA